MREYEKEQYAEQTDIGESIEMVVPGEVVNKHHQDSPAPEKVEIGRRTSSDAVRPVDRVGAERIHRQCAEIVSLRVVGVQIAENIVVHTTQ
jgi:hypothetical protein